MSRNVSATEKEKQLARREGFIACFIEASWRKRDSGWSFCIGEAAVLTVAGGIEKYVAEKYPLPKVPKPRVATDRDGDTWRWVDGQLQMSRLGREGWMDVGMLDIRESSREAIAKVLANPTDWVEEDETPRVVRLSDLKGGVVPPGVIIEIPRSPQKSSTESKADPIAKQREVL